MSVHTEQRKLAAIMFTDMLGYSALSQRLTRADRNTAVIFACCHTAEKSESLQCVDKLRAISQVISKMCFGRNGRYGNGKIDQSDHFRRHRSRALAGNI